MAQLSDKIEKVKQEMEDGLQAKRDSALQRKQTTQAHEMFGAIRAVHNLGKMLSAQSLHALQMFQQQKGHEEYGFSSFDEFLDGYENSPMTKNQYYDRIKLLKKEGDATFDLLNSLKISARDRKLLTTGAIQIEGDEVIIGESRANLFDTRAIKELVKELARDNQQLSEKQVELETKIEKEQAKSEELQRKLDSGEGKPSEDPHGSLLVEVLLNLNNLRIEAKKLTIIEAEDAGRVALRSILGQVHFLIEAYRLGDVFKFEHFETDRPRKSLMEMTDAERERRIAAQLEDYPESTEKEEKANGNLRQFKSTRKQAQKSVSKSAEEPLTPNEEELADLFD